MRSPCFAAKVASKCQFSLAKRDTFHLTQWYVTEQAAGSELWSLWDDPTMSQSVLTVRNHGHCVPGASLDGPTTHSPQSRLTGCEIMETNVPKGSEFPQEIHAWGREGTVAGCQPGEEAVSQEEMPWSSDHSPGHLQERQEHR